MTARHRVRQARRDLARAGLPTSAVSRSAHGQYDVAIHPDGLDRPTVARVFGVLHERWAGIVADPPEEYWEYLFAFHTAPKPYPQHLFEVKP